MGRKKPRKRRRRQGRRGGLLPWLGLGALGLATVWVAKRKGGSSVTVPIPVPPSLDEPKAALDALPDDVTVSWIAGPSGNLRVAERHPEGSLTIIFVHGLAGRLEHWAPELHGLGPGLRTLALDLPGHGESDPERDGDYSIASLASSIGAVFEGFGVRRGILVAHSLGAIAAIDYAVRRPDRVAGLLLLDPSGDQSRLAPEDRELFLQAVRHDARSECELNFRHFLGGAKSQIAQQILSDLEATEKEVLRGMLEGSAAYAPAAALERYSGPVLSVVSAANDSAVSLHRLCPDLRCRRMMQASHWLMLDRPDEILEVLWDFLEEVPQS